MKDKRNCNNMYPVYPNMPYMNQMPMPMPYYEQNINNVDINSLERQINNVSFYCIARGYQFKVISDLGSGLNYNKKGLIELLDLICSNEIERIVINYKDRLIRYGYEIIEEVCKHHNVSIEVINHTDDKTYEAYLEDYSKFIKRVIDEIKKIMTE